MLPALVSRNGLTKADLQMKDLYSGEIRKTFDLLYGILIVVLVSHPPGMTVC
jgi:hypothetical protein